MIKDILTYPENKDILTMKSEEVSPDEDISELIQDLKDTLTAHETGVGISAIQIGIPKQVCVIRSSENEEFVMINPKITKRSGLCLFKEGCLSAPGKRAIVTRSKRISVEYLNENKEIKRTTRGRTYCNHYST